MNNGDDVERGVNGDARGDGDRRIFGGEVERGVPREWRGIATRSISPVGHTVQFRMYGESCCSKSSKTSARARTSRLVGLAVANFDAENRPAAAQELRPATWSSASQLLGSSMGAGQSAAYEDEPPGLAAPPAAAPPRRQPSDYGLAAARAAAPAPATRQARAAAEAKAAVEARHAAAEAKAAKSRAPAVAKKVSRAPSEDVVGVHAAGSRSHLQCEFGSFFGLERRDYFGPGFQRLIPDFSV